MNKKIIISGGSGFIGSKLSALLIDNNYDVFILTRAKSIISKDSKIQYIYWSPDSGKDFDLSSNLDDFENAYAFINLSGVNIGSKRWSNAFKLQIINSRINSLSLLENIIGQLNNKPVKFISVSASGFYGNRKDELLDESSIGGNDFLAGVCKKWEDAALNFNKFKCKVSIIRIGVVMDRFEGAFKKLLFPYKLFVGGPVGSGKQFMPFIHINDLINVFLYILNSDNTGIINASIPNFVTMNEFSKVLGNKLHRPHYLKIPSFALKLIIGEMSSLILNSQKIKPSVLLKNNFIFKYPTIEKIIDDIV